MINLLFKIHRIIQREIIKRSHTPRPSSHPYLSGDSFRSLAQHIHDETGVVDPLRVNKGDIIFVSNRIILSFMKEIHPLILHEYILVVHNGDTAISKEVIDLLDKKVYRIYAQNSPLTHEKLIHIPIGLENLYFYVHGIPNMFDRARKKVAALLNQKKNRIFFFFTISTNQTERIPAHSFFENYSHADTVHTTLLPIEHLTTLMKYKFIASPPGNGLDCCRTWEGLYLKTIPIVKDFVSMHYFASLGLPLWIVKDWHELDNLTENDLAKKYDYLTKNAKWEALYMDFWIKIILNDQAHLRKENLDILTI